MFSAKDVRQVCAFVFKIIKNCQSNTGKIYVNHKGVNFNYFNHKGAHLPLVFQYIYTGPTLTQITCT